VDVLLATDADWIIADVTAALGGPDVRFIVVRDGRLVSKQVRASTPDLVICDLQIGTMGGMAVTMDLRLDESSGYLPHVPVLMLLDRVADVHLARRSGANGWMFKPVNPLRLKQAQRALLAGHDYHAGEIIAPTPAVDEDDEVDQGDQDEVDAGQGDAAEDSATPEEEPATAG
jgi:DNA-binding response OmpR family regulator